MKHFQPVAHGSGAWREELGESLADERRGR